MPAMAKFRNGLQVGEVSYRKPTQGGPRPLPGMPEMCESASLIFQFLKNKHRGKIAQTACNQDWHQHGW